LGWAREGGEGDFSSLLSAFLLFCSLTVKQEPGTGYPAPLANNGMCFRVLPKNKFEVEGE